jgi:hypothetical protein
MEDLSEREDEITSPLFEVICKLREIQYVLPHSAAYVS